MTTVASADAQPGPPRRDGARNNGGRATVAQSLRLAGGVAAGERASLVQRLKALDSQLLRYPADAVELEFSITARGTRGQRLTLECWIAGKTRLVATSGERDLRAALMRVREGLRRQLDDSATGCEPRNNRQLRPSPTGSARSSHRQVTPAGSGPERTRDSGAEPARAEQPRLPGTPHRGMV